MHYRIFMKKLNGNDTGKGLSVTFFRLLVFLYTQQIVNVRWGYNNVSSMFTMKNGVRQGAILSAIAYCSYFENIFKIRKKIKSGCWINGMFMGPLPVLH